MIIFHQHISSLYWSCQTTHTVTNYRSQRSFNWFGRKAGFHLNAQRPQAGSDKGNPLHKCSLPNQTPSLIAYDHVKQTAYRGKWEGGKRKKFTQKMWKQTQLTEGRKSCKLIGCTDPDQLRIYLYTNRQEGIWVVTTINSKNKHLFLFTMFRLLLLFFLYIRWFYIYL